MGYPSLTLKEKYAIQGMLANGLSVAEMARVVKKSSTCVSEYIKKNLTVKKIDERFTQINDLNLGVPKKQSKLVILKRAGATVMTQAGSEIGDEIIKHIPKLSRSVRGHLYTSDGEQI
jgi:IS30 family transposase